MPDENKMSIEKYISDRLDDQIKYYDLKSIEYKKKHENISLATIIISALIALVPAFIDILPNCKSIITFLSALLAATITVLQTIDKLKKYNDLFYQFRMTCEKLKQEKELYLYQSGEYGNRKRHMGSIKRKKSKLISLLSNKYF